MSLVHDARGRFTPSPEYQALTDAEKLERKRLQRLAAQNRYMQRHPGRRLARERAKNAKLTAPERAERARKTRVYQQRNRAIMNEAKSVPCSRCKETFPPVAMDLHHRDPSTKHSNIGRQAVAACWSEKRLRTEIAKCDVLCACCHRIHHANERQS